MKQRLHQKSKESTVSRRTTRSATDESILLASIAREEQDSSREERVRSYEIREAERQILRELERTLLGKEQKSSPGQDPGREASPAPAIQTKQTVSHPRDPLEREANRIAREIGPESTRSLSPKSADHTSGALQEEEITSAPAGGSGSSSPLPPSLEQDLSQLNSGGTPLTSAQRAPFEASLGADFKDVRVHTHETAQELSSRLHAKAFTLGNTIAFGKGEFAPNTAEGKELLAHELVHVVQQRGGSPGIQRREQESSQRSAPEERGREGIILQPSTPRGLYTRAEVERMLQWDRLQTGRGVYKRVERGGSIYFEMEVGSGIIESLQLDPSGSVIQCIYPAAPDGSVGIPLSVRYVSGWEWVIPLRGESEESTGSDRAQSPGSALSPDRILSLRNELYQGDAGPLLEKGKASEARIGKELNLIPPHMRGVWCAAMSEWAVLKAIPLCQQSCRLTFSPAFLLPGIVTFPASSLALAALPESSIPLLPLPAPVQVGVEGLQSLQLPQLRLQKISVRFATWAPGPVLQGPVHALHILHDGAALRAHAVLL